jgi:hypothetical protein
MPPRKTKNNAASGTTAGSSVAEFPLASSMEQMEIDQVEYLAPPEVAVLTIVPNSAVQSSTVPAATEENNPPVPQSFASGAESVPQATQVPQSSVGSMGYRSAAPLSAGSMAANSFPSYRSGTNASQPVVVQTAQRWDGLKWDLGRNLVSHLDEVNRKISALALTREQAVEYFLDSLTPPMQEVARLNETTTNSWADLAAVLKQAFHSPNDITGWRAIITKVSQGPRTSMQFWGDLMKVHREWEPHLRAEEILQMDQACITALLHQGSRRTTKIASVFHERSPQATWREYVNHLLTKIRQDARVENVTQLDVSNINQNRPWENKSRGVGDSGYPSPPRRPDRNSTSNRYGTAPYQTRMCRDSPNCNRRGCRYTHESDRNRPRNNGPTCSICERPGHVAEKCFDRRP